MKLESASAIDQADIEASRLELEQRLESAEQILQRIRRSLPTIKGITLSDVRLNLTHLARVNLELGISPRKLLVDAERIPNKEALKLYGYNSGLNDADVKSLDVTPFLESAIDSKSNSDNKFWDAALSNFEEADAKKVFYLEYALLQEWRGNYAEAKRSLVENLTTTTDKTHSFYIACINYCARHDDVTFASMLESPLIESDSTACSELFRFYLSNQHKELAHAFASKILESARTGRHFSPVLNTADAISTLQLLKDDSDQVLLSEYIQKGFRRNVVTLDLIPVFNAVNKKGWVNFTWNLFEQLTQDDSLIMYEPSQLAVFAQFFEEQNENDRALDVYEKILHLDQLVHHGDAQKKYKQIATLCSLMQQESIPETPHKISLLQKAHQLRDSFDIRIQAEECLAQSKQLENTGEQLESAGAYSDAERMYRESYEIYSKNLGLSDESTQVVRVKLARVLAHEGKLADSSNLYESSLGPYRNHVVPTDSTYAKLLESYGQALAENKQNKKADVIYEEARKYYQSCESGKHR